MDRVDRESSHPTMTSDHAVQFALGVLILPVLVGTVRTRRTDARIAPNSFPILRRSTTGACPRGTDLDGSFRHRTNVPDGEMEVGCGVE